MRTLTRYIPNGMTLTLSNPALGIEIYTNQEKLTAIGYGGKGGKPVFNYYYRSLESLRESISKNFSNLEKYYQSKLDHKTEKKAALATFSTQLKEGDVLSGSWGYDQTNAEVYRVVRVLGKRQVEIAKACLENEPTHFMQGVYHLLPGYRKGTEIVKTVQLSMYSGEYIKLHECCDVSPTSSTSFSYSTYA